MVIFEKKKMHFTVLHANYSPVLLHKLCVNRISLIGNRRQSTGHEDNKSILLNRKSRLQRMKFCPGMNSNIERLVNSERKVEIYFTCSHGRCHVCWHKFLLEVLKKHWLTSMKIFVNIIMGFFFISKSLNNTLLSSTMLPITPFHIHVWLHSRCILHGTNEEGDSIYKNHRQL